METKVPSAPITHWKWPPCLMEAAFPDNRNCFPTWVNYQVASSTKSLKLPALYHFILTNYPSSCGETLLFTLKKKKTQHFSTLLLKRSLCAFVLCVFSLFSWDTILLPHAGILCIAFTCWSAAPSLHRSQLLGHVVDISHCHRITESIGLEKASEIIKFNLWPKITMSSRPWH